ncbi:MAG: hypothetical protein WCF90_07230, partial [Methanomicrobiales archaeon]
TPASRFLREVCCYIWGYNGSSLMFKVVIHGRHSHAINNPAVWSGVFVVMNFAIIVFDALRMEGLVAKTRC